MEINTHATGLLPDPRKFFIYIFPLSFPPFSFNGNCLVLGKRALKAPQECFILGIQMEKSGSFVHAYFCKCQNMQNCTDIGYMPHLINHLVKFRCYSFFMLNYFGFVAKEKC